MSRLSNLWANLLDFLFPSIEEVLDPLTEKQKQFVTTCELAQLDKHMGPHRGHRLGRKKFCRVDLAKAFVAKAVYDFPTTKALRDRLLCDKNLRMLCGWECAGAVPSEATFSRAFDEFAKAGLGGRVHEAMIRSYGEEKLIGHVSRDSTAVPARERPAPAPPKTKPPKRKTGRPKKGEAREPAPLTRLELQPGRTLEENLKDLPRLCDSGGKRGSKGKKEFWRGYKLHVDLGDGGIPLSAIVTSASVHDSQVAIPLMQMTAQRVTSLYDLMDSAYGARAIEEFSRSLGHVPIVEKIKRGSIIPPPMDPATARRYDERSTAERFNSDLKDNHGGRHVRVRGHAKVTLHLMFSIITITALQMVRLLE